MEAVCCGNIFMSIFGKVFLSLGFLILTLHNINGSFIYRKITPQNVQIYDHWPREDAKTYCIDFILKLFTAMHFMVYGFVALAFIVSFIYCFKKIKGFQSENEDISTEDIELGLNRLDRKMAKGLGIDLRPKENRNKRKTKKNLRKS